MSVDAIRKSDVTTNRNQRSRWQAVVQPIQDTWKQFSRHPTGMIGIFLILGFALSTLAHPLLLRTIWKPVMYDPILGFDLQILLHPSGPSAQHLFGTDAFGRDVLSQVLYGARYSFAVGILAAFVAVILSTTLGSSAGYFGGKTDLVLMGISDVFVLLPAPIILLIVGLLTKLEWYQMAILYGILAGLGAQAIIVKAQTLGLKTQPYIEVAIAAGGSHFHVLKKHILRGLLPLSMVHFFFTVVGAVLTESLLSYFSRTRVDVSWGTMIWLGQENFRRHTLDGQWHAILPPAIAILLFCSAFYMVGRGLDETLNPRLRKR
jgi:peptide/nickel transport system permease protein